MADYGYPVGNGPCNRSIHSHPDENLMPARRSPLFVALAIVLTGTSPLAFAQSASPEVEARLQRLEARQLAYEKEIEARDMRIRELESQLGKLQTEQPTTATAVVAPPVPAAPVVPAAPQTAASTVPASIATADAGPDENSPFGLFSPGKGFTVAKTSWGELQLSAYSYLRYLNQSGLDESYVDAAGNVRAVDSRNDIQLNKVFLYTKGWFIDPRFTYNFYVWSSATALGTDTNNLVAGSLGFAFDPAFNLGAGVSALPSTRSMDGQFPYWHRVDARLVADEFMRGSFTQGIWANGRIAEGLDYKVMLGNNLSAFGVSANQLDSRLDTMAASLVWMPSTGEFGPRAGFGDYEYHDKAATLFSVHYTRSTEDKQSQPSQTAPENTQIRLSDGRTLFSTGVLAPGVSVDRLDYQMMALSGGVKYRGFYLEAEAYRRWLSGFRADGPIPFNRLTDSGAQLTTSMMAIENTLQVYANGSKIWGDYGNPWDAGVGVNWWPFKKRGFRINSEFMYLKDSPVGAASLPYPVGANGWLFVTSAEVAF